MGRGSRAASIDDLHDLVVVIDIGTLAPMSAWDQRLRRNFVSGSIPLGPEGKLADHTRRAPTVLSSPYRTTSTPGPLGRDMTSFASLGEGDKPPQRPCRVLRSNPRLRRIESRSSSCAKVLISHLRPWAIRERAGTQTFQSSFA